MAGPGRGVLNESAECGAAAAGEPAVAGEPAAAAGDAGEPVSPTASPAASTIRSPERSLNTGTVPGQ